MAATAETSSPDGPIPAGHGSEAGDVAAQLSPPRHQRPSLPSPPFIDVPGLPNFRDVGGYPIASSGDPPTKMVRRGVLFRSSEPSRLTDAGAIVLRERLGIARVFDLRSAVEIERAARGNSGGGGGGGGGEGWDLREIEGAERVFVPVFLDQDYSPEALALRMRDYSGGVEGFVRAYSSILESAAEPAHRYQPFPTILAHLASTTSPPTPILVHCTAGKDRTGVLCALVLSLCGVADGVVAHEYSLTDAGLAERKEEFVTYIMRHDAMRGNRAGAESMVSSRKENMLATLDMLRKAYGSVERYMIERCRLLPDHVEQIRRNLIVDIGGENQPIDWQSHTKLTL